MTIQALHRTALLLILALPMPLVACAGESQVSKHAILGSEGFLGYHPDLHNRLRGMDEHARGNYAHAMTAFRRAAHFGDKPSQAMLAEMYWRGEGTPVQAAEAYIWMDLAAERKYEVFLSLRERYWASLSEAERADALARGQSYYDEFGDDVALKRLEKKLRRGKRAVTGSRVGFVGALTILIPTPGGNVSVSGDDYYDDTWWDLDHYLSWQAETWQKPVTGHVEVGAIHTDPSPSLESEPDDP